MLQPQTNQAIDNYWSGQFGLAATQLNEPLTFTAPWRRPDPPNAISVFVRREFRLVTAPTSLVGRLERAAAENSTAALLNPEFWHDALKNNRIQIIGPAYLGYADAKTFEPVPTDQGRLLGSADAAVLQRFEQTIGPTAWEHSGLGEHGQPIWATFDETEITAAAGYLVWGQAIAHIGVSTHPDYRGRGLGQTVVSGIGRHALDNNLVLQYRTLWANKPSLGIAGKLGFELYASTLWVRLQQE